MIPQAMRIVRWHGKRLPREDDLVSLAALKMLDALQKPQPKPLPPFIRMFSRAVDAARHQIARAARREVPSEGGSLIEHTPAQFESQARAKAVLEEAIAELSLEEQTVLSRILQGHSPPEVARETGVSLRTIYRRIKSIRQRLSDRNPDAA